MLSHVIKTMGQSAMSELTQLKHIIRTMTVKGSMPTISSIEDEMPCRYVCIAMTVV